MIAQVIGAGRDPLWPLAAGCLQSIDDGPSVAADDIEDHGVVARLGECRACVIADRTRTTGEEGSACREDVVFTRQAPTTTVMGQIK